jgi:NADPH:quinone reductase-like Zn-dependent oxidoreductase
MLAVRVHDYGGVEQLRLEDVPTPTPAPGEALVRVHAASVNPVDWKMRSGAAKARYPLAFPAILGRDFAGVVAAVDPLATEFAIGDEVYGYCGVGRDGAYAEYIATPATQLARKPTSLTMIEAAAMPTVALTAYISLFEHAQLRAGQSALIHAGAGGVGSVAVQLAKWAGARVYATGSANTADLITSLGADVVIDYRHEKFENVATGVDVVLDTIGSDTRARSWSCIRPGGYLVSIVSPAPASQDMRDFKVEGSWAGARPDGALLGKLAALIDDGHIRPLIDTVLPLTEIREAHRISETGHAHGKVMLKLA